MSIQTVIVSEQVERIRALFEAASESEDSEREALLRRAGEESPELRTLVEQMLRADAESHSILDHALGLAAGLPLNEPALEEGDSVGVYRILRKIGGGGMGVVYLAERGSERVAIKMMLWSSPDFFQRYLQEQTILRTLQHPNIARLVDSGQTEENVPYLVMEYVDGDPIHRYCEHKNLSVNRCIELFRQVCAAVIYMHQHLVVHRDLKPSNILVTADGTVKILDFGIAKLLPGHQYAYSATQTSAGAMTPDYASPEQIRARPISTLTDVYTLRVLLYELLTGVNPFTDREREVHETLRRICEEEPVKPSIVSGCAQLRGEVDNIVLKALQKQPASRYASVEQLDADLRNFLAGLPVMAQGDSALYRAGKILKRYKASVAAAAVVLISLCGGVIATTQQAGVARRERTRAEAQARAAETARTLAEQERSRAENQMIEAQRERANAERRLAELQKVARAAVKIYQSTEQSAVPPEARALIAENARDSLLTLRREDTFEPVFAPLLDSASAEVHGYEMADASAAWQVPHGWSANQTKPGEYRVGIDRQFLYQGKASLFLRSLVAAPVGAVQLMQSFQAERFRGARVRLTGFLETASVSKRAYLVLVIAGDGENQASSTAGVSGTSPWKKYEVVMDVPDNSDSIRIVLSMTGTGTVWAANFGFERVSSRVPLTMPAVPRNPQNLTFTAK